MLSFWKWKEKHLLFCACRRESIFNWIPSLTIITFLRDGIKQSLTLPLLKKLPYWILHSLLGAMIITCTLKEKNVRKSTEDSLIISGYWPIVFWRVKYTVTCRKDNIDWSLLLDVIKCYLSPCLSGCNWSCKKRLGKHTKLINVDNYILQFTTLFLINRS